MKSTHRIRGTLEVLGPLVDRPDSACLARVLERGKRRYRVLRWIRDEPAGPIAPLLREDILDLLSMGHPSLGLWTALGSEPGTGRAFLIRPHVEGKEIQAHLARKAPRDILPWLIECARALGNLHRFGFLHRNVKPSNLLVPSLDRFGRASREPRVILSDPAWWPDEAEGQAGHPWVAPEVRRGERATFAADLYSLGTVFRWLLPGGSDAATLSAGKPRQGFPLDMDRIVMKMLHPDPARRYQDAREVIEDMLRLGAARSSPAEMVPECFFDRRDDLDRTRRCLERVGHAAAIAVAGEAGMGKTAFLRRLELEAQLLGYQTASVSCRSAGKGPLAPIRALMDQMLPPGAGGHSLRARFRKRLGAFLLPPGDQEGPAGPRLTVQDLARVCLEAAIDLPALILVDQLEAADPATVEIISILVNEIALGRDGRGDAARVSVAVSYRSESPYRMELRPLLQAFARPMESVLTLEMARLPAEVLEQWWEVALAAEPGGGDRAAVPAGLEGRPSAVRIALADARRVGVASTRTASGAPHESGTIQGQHMAMLDPAQRTVLQLLAVLERPAALRLLRALLSSRLGARLGSLLAPLLENETLTEAEEGFSFKHDAVRKWVLDAMSGDTVRHLHSRVASALEADPSGSIDEIAHHWIRSGTRRGLSTILRAARSCSRDHDHRRALQFYHGALELSSRTKDRSRIARETAEAHARLGEFHQAIELLQTTIDDPRATAGSSRLHRLIGTYYHRAGKMPQAVLHLEKGLSLSAGRGGFLEQLRIEAELAEIAGNLGDHARAEAISSRALARIDGTGRTRDPELLRAEMMLLETLAHSRLRRFRYREARPLFEKSLRLGRRIGAVSESSLILNNLGILHIQMNRFPQAIACYERARALSERLGDHQNLANIHSNLAVLHAKVGEPESADENTRLAALHASRCDSARTDFLRLHSVGLVDLSLGRYATAIESFQGAISLGEDLGDSFLVAFDLVYLAECHLYRGEYKAGSAVLERVLHMPEPIPEPILPMVHARRAVIAALRADRRQAQAALGAYVESGEGQIPSLEAANNLLVGWAHRMLGETEAARTALEEARAFFKSVGALPAAIHAEVELAAVETHAGRAHKAGRRLRKLRMLQACGKGALRNPMLSARLLAYEARASFESTPPDLSRASTALAEAESHLIGRRLRDLEGLVQELKVRIRHRELGSDGRDPVPPIVPARASSREPTDHGQALEVLKSFKGMGRQWVRFLEEEVDAGHSAGVRAQMLALLEQAERAQRDSEAEPPAASIARNVTSIAGRSNEIRRVIELVRQVGPTMLPVLVTGETGTGKELVARALHGESSRRSGPFVSINSAALPEPLLEAELFGHARGAFSGAEEDQKGLLAAADGGTFLFDEVGEMPISIQAKILRVLERAEVRPVGGTEQRKVDVRNVFATNADLRKAVAAGRFREDLFFRLSVFEIRLPSLRQRIEDLPILVESILASAGLCREEPLFDEEAMRILSAYPWPGNVRELENVVMRAALSCARSARPQEVRLFLGKAPEGGLFSTAILRSRSIDRLHAQLDEEYLAQLHRDHGGDLKAMARAMDMSVRALYKRFKALGIRPRDLKLL